MTLAELAGDLRWRHVDPIWSQGVRVHESGGYALGVLDPPFEI